ncbi:hypothetical protein [Alicyclobacillus sp. SO9]|uniref:hypothetical protein n=1 Tax=Alicyclobacillus sp. SO9 TaxID=2665646 RepID=UPI0018E78063|nr:hypothetical protein [Alicyclobacillus sp. SO9]QQE80827.1 hypothetical protein GI364_10835 [Alicyclobacillus sp. SO9]
MEEAVLVTVLLVSGIVYYMYKRISKVQKGSTPPGIGQWLRGLSNAQAGTESHLAKPRPPVQGQSEDGFTPVIQEQITSMLDEVYEEFVSETAEVRTQFAQELERVQKELNSRLEQIEMKLDELNSKDSAPIVNPPEEQEFSAAGRADRTNLGDSVSNLKPEADSEDERSSLQSHPVSEMPAAAEADKSFQILEYLYSGKTVAEVASSLEVGVEEVERVRRLLQSPPSK